MSGFGETKKTNKIFRSKRYDYLNDYKRGMNGQYVYYGSYHVYQGTDKDRRTLIFRMLFMDVILVALYIVGGCLQAGKLWQAPYVVIPFGLEAVVLFLLCWKTISLSCEKNRVKDYIYKKTVPWVSPVTWVLTVLEGISVITALIYTLFMSQGEMILMCVLYTVIKAVMGALAFIYGKHFRKHEWKPEASDVAEENETAASVEQ